MSETLVAAPAAPCCRWGLTARPHALKEVKPIACRCSRVVAHAQHAQRRVLRRMFMCSLLTLAAFARGVLALSLVVLSSGMFYWWEVRCRPDLVIGSKVAKLVAQVPALHRRLLVTPWAFFGHFQTLLFIAWHLIGSKGRKAVHFQREMLRCRDGGEVALDWICLDRAGLPREDYDKIIVLQLPGIVGKASNKYHIRFAQHTGWPSVVKSWRGIDCDLVTPRPETWDLHAVQDTVEVAQHLRRSFPRAKLVILGWSHGGNVALAALAHEKLFDAGIAVSAPNDLSLVIPWLETSQTFPYAYINTVGVFKEIDREANRNVIAAESPVMADKLRVVKELLRLRQLATHLLIRRPYGTTYHELITRHYTNHDSAMAYYKSLGDMVEHALPRITTPTLCLLSEDDPVTPSFSFRHYLEKASPHTVFAMTHKGGHCGWFCGLQGFSWVNEVAMEFCSNIQ